MSGGGGGRSPGGWVMPRSSREMISIGRDGENGGERKSGREMRRDFMALGVGRGDSAIRQATEIGAGAGSKEGGEPGLGFACERLRDILVAKLLLGSGLGQSRNLWCREVDSLLERCQHGQPISGEQGTEDPEAACHAGVPLPATAQMPAHRPHPHDGCTSADPKPSLCSCEQHFPRLPWTQRWGGLWSQPV